MAVRQFRKSVTSDKDISDLSQAFYDYSIQLDRIPILDGVLLTDVVITTGAVRYIEHKLQRPPRGWVVVRNNANSVIYETTASTTKDVLALNSSATATVSLWVF